MTVDWSVPQPSYEELHDEIAALKAELRYLRPAYEMLRADYDETQRIVEFIIEHRANAKLATS